MTKWAIAAHIIGNKNPTHESLTADTASKAGTFPKKKYL